jgi:hypothetical protein
LLIRVVLVAGQGSEGAMFLRIVRAAGGKGVKHEYLRVVEAYREGGKTRHRTCSIWVARTCWRRISTSPS